MGTRGILFFGKAEMVLNLGDDPLVRAGATELPLSELVKVRIRQERCFPMSAEMQEVVDRLERVISGLVGGNMRCSIPDCEALAWVDVEILDAREFPIGVTRRPLPVCCQHLLEIWHLCRRNDRMLFEYCERDNSPKERI